MMPWNIAAWRSLAEGKLEGIKFFNTLNLLYDKCRYCCR